MASENGSQLSGSEVPASDMPEVASAQPVIQPTPAQLANPEPQDSYFKQDANSVPESDMTDSMKFSQPSEQIKTMGEGVLKGVVGPLAPMLEQVASKMIDNQSFAQTSKNIRGREETNPNESKGAEAVGFVGSMFTGAGEAGLIAKATQGIKAVEGAGMFAKAGAAAVRGAIENAAFQAGDEVSKMIVQDPHSSTSSAISNIGLAALLGGGLGGGLSAGAELLAKSGNKTRQMLTDFNSRMKEHVGTPDPVEGLSKELSEHYDNIKHAADDMYSGHNIKGQDIEKLAPVETTPKISEQVESVKTKLDSQIEHMVDNPNRYPPTLADKLFKDVSEFKKSVSEAKNPAELFNATQELKQNMYAYAQYGKQVTRLDSAYDFVKDAKEIGHELKLNLEDKGVWGKAAERQQAINEANTKFSPSLKDFESKFTSKIEGDSVVDPAKVASYINQLEKPQGTLKKQVLANFLKNSQKYGDEVNKSHANLGIESPITNTPLNMAYSTLQKKTLGSRMADHIVAKGLNDAGGKVAGAAVGGALAHSLGMSPELGALVGSHALGSLFGTALPALTKGMISLSGHAAAFTDAANYIASVAKGEKLATRAVKAVFTEDKDVLPSSAMPTEKELDKLDKTLEGMKDKTHALAGVGGQMGTYLPDHTPLLAQTALNAVQYINSQRPNAETAQVLDSKLPVAKYQTAEFRQLLAIAQQPMLVLDKMKKGTLVPKDVQTLNVLYPSLHKSLSDKLMAQVFNLKGQNKTVPYKTKMGLALFTAQPLDSTLTQSSIMSAQIGLMPKAGAQESPQKPGKPPSSASMKELSKAPAANRTPSQARQYNQQTKD